MGRPVLPEFLSGLAGGLFETPPDSPSISTGVPRTRPQAFLRALGLLGSLSLAVAAAGIALAYAGGLSSRKVPGTESDRTVLPSEGPAAALSEVLAFDDQVTPRPWTSIVLHHSATARGSAQSFDAYHRAHNGWRCLGYHFVVGNGTDAPDGAVETGPRWRRQEAGAHAHSSEFNEWGIGICLVGNFDLNPPTDAQLEAARALVRELCRRFKIPTARVFGHGQIREGGSTACPGKLFPMDKILDGLDR